MKTKFPFIDIRDIAREVNVPLEFREFLEGHAYMQAEILLADGRTLLLRTGDTESEYKVDAFIEAQVETAEEARSADVRPVDTVEANSTRLLLA